MRETIEKCPTKVVLSCRKEQQWARKCQAYRHAAQRVREMSELLVSNPRRTRPSSSRTYALLLNGSKLRGVGGGVGVDWRSCRQSVGWLGRTGVLHSVDVGLRSI